MEIFTLLVYEMIMNAAFNLSMTDVAIGTDLQHQALNVYYQFRDELAKEEEYREVAA
jgi:hypothetical protein